MPTTLEDSPLEYNGIDLFIVKTNNFTQRPIYTSDNMDYLYTEFTLDVNCVYNPQATSYDTNVPPDFTTGIQPSQTNASIRHYLLQPRKNLFFLGFSPEIDEPNYVIQSPQDLDGIDANNGPMPLACDIFRIDGDRTYHVHFVIRTWLIECPVFNENALLSNRWSQSTTINFQRLMVRKTVGQAYFRTDILFSSNTFVDQYRAQILGPIPPKPGLFREECKFIITPQGNAIHYEIIDIERMYNLGDTVESESYVVKADGYFSQGTMTDGGDKIGAAIGISLIEMKVQLWGSAEANNWNLIQLALGVINQQIPLGDIGAKALAILRSVNMTQSIVDHYVEVAIAVQVGKPDQQNVAAAVPFNDKYLKMIEPVNNLFDPAGQGINPDLPNDVGSRGSDQVLLRSALISSACSPQPFGVLNASVDNPGQQPLAGEPPTITIYETDTLPPVNTQYYPSSTGSFYNYYNTESQYSYNSGKIQAPIANPNNPSQSGGNNPPTQGGQTMGTNMTGPYQCEVLNFCAPYTSIIVDWFVECVGLPPNIPHFIKSIQCLSQDHQPVLTEASTTVPSTSLSNDLQTWIFNVSGRYKYIVPFAPDPTNPPMIVFDVPQNINAQYGDAFINGDQSGNCATGQLTGQYVHGIIDTEQDDDQGGSPGNPGQGQGDN